MRTRIHVNVFPILAFMSSCAPFQLSNLPTYHNREKPSLLSSQHHQNIQKRTLIPPQLRCDHQFPFSFALLSSRNDDKNETDTNEEHNSSNASITTRIYFDIEINKVESGRLTFQIDTSENLPTQIYAANLIKICSGQRSSIDPKCKYIGCQFQHSPQSVETFPQYRWTHVLCGNGRNAIGPPSERIPLSSNMASCTHSLYGGQYYGRMYEPVNNIHDNGDISANDSDYDDFINDYGVFLTVPLVGPQRGSSSFS